MQKQKWSEQDLAILREKYPTTDTQKLASIMGRSVSSLMQQACNLNIHKRVFWTTQEIKYLRENYNKLNHKQIAAKLKRSPVAVRMYFMRMKRDKNGANTGG